MMNTFLLCIHYMHIIMVWQVLVLYIYKLTNVHFRLFTVFQVIHYLLFYIFGDTMYDVTLDHLQCVPSLISVFRRLVPPCECSGCLFIPSSTMSQNGKKFYIKYITVNIQYTVCASFKYLYVNLFAFQKYIHCALVYLHSDDVTLKKFRAYKKKIQCIVSTITYVSQFIYINVNAIILTFLICVKFRNVTST